MKKNAEKKAVALAIAFAIIVTAVTIVAVLATDVNFAYCGYH